MLKRLTTLGLGLFAASALAAPAFLDRLVLLNEEGLNQPPLTEGKGALGVFVSFRQDLPLTACNAVQGQASAASGWVFTARHCWPSQAEGPTEAYFISFHRRTGRQLAVKLGAKPVALKVALDANSPLVEADLIAVPLPLNHARGFDSLDIFAPSRRQNGEDTEFSLWVYHVGVPTAGIAQGQDAVKVPWVRHDCEGLRGSAPAFQVAYETLKESYYLSYSKQGRKADEALGLFLKGCEPGPSSSGAVVFDAEGFPAGIFHSGLTTATFKKSWDDDFRFRFERQAKKANLPLPWPEAEPQFSWLWGKKETGFTPASSKHLFGVALDLARARASGQPFLNQLYDLQRK